MSAPPGLGKTTLTSQWLSGRNQLSAWVSLNEGESNLPQFLRYLCAAVRRCVPEACATLQGLLTQVYLPLWITWPIFWLINALPTGLILVLDDYYHIHTPEVHQVMRHLQRYRPSWLHL